MGLHQDSDSGACSDGLTLAPASKAAAAAVGGSFCGCVHCPYYTWWAGLRAAAAADTFHWKPSTGAGASELPLGEGGGSGFSVASQGLGSGFPVSRQCLGSVL